MCTKSFSHKCFITDYVSSWVFNNNISFRNAQNARLWKYYLTLPNLSLSKSSFILSNCEHFSLAPLSFTFNLPTSTVFSLISNSAWSSSLQLPPPPYPHSQRARLTLQLFTPKLCLFLPTPKPILTGLHVLEMWWSWMRNSKARWLSPLRWNRPPILGTWSPPAPFRPAIRRPGGGLAFLFYRFCNRVLETLPSLPWLVSSWDLSSSWPKLPWSLQR